MQQRHAAPPPPVTDDDGFRSWCDAREPALHRLAVLLTADEPGARDLVRQVLPRMDSTWSKIGALAADGDARARLVDAYRRQRWQAGAAGTAGMTHDRLATPDDLTAAAWSRVALLPAQVRAAAVLTRHEGLDDTEAARLLRLTPGAVRAADADAVAAVAALLEEVRRRDAAPSAVPPDPGRLLTEALTARADAAAYTPVPRDEVEATAAGLRLRRRWLVLGSAGAVLVAGVGVAAALGVGPAEPPKPPAALSSEERAPFGPLGQYERTGLPDIPYLVENVLHDPDGSRVELPVTRPRAAVRFQDHLYVTALRDDGDQLYRVDASGQVDAAWPTLGEPAVARDGSTIAWLERRGADRLVLHRGAERQRIDRTARIVGVAGEVVVLNASDGVWVTNLRSTPRRLTGLRVATSVADEGIVAGISEDGAVLVDLLGRVLWSSPDWQPGPLSPDGRYVVAVGATRTRLVNAVLDARDGSLVREFDWSSPAPGVLDVRWEGSETVLALAVDQGESAILRIAVADGEITRATPPMSGDAIGMSRYRFAAP